MEAEVTIGHAQEPPKTKFSQLAMMFVWALTEPATTTMNEPQIMRTGFAIQTTRKRTRDGGQLDPEELRSCKDLG